MTEAMLMSTASRRPALSVSPSAAATDAETAPVRLINTLTDGQSVTVEVAGPTGTFADRLILSREGDHLRVERSSQQTAAQP
jgi:hypothetical protein